MVQREKAHARSTEASSKGFHIGATRPRPAERQNGGHHEAQDGVIASAFGSRRPTLVRIACTSYPPSNLVVVGSTHLAKRERERGDEFTLAVHRTSSRTPLARLFFPCTVHHQPQRQSTTPHTGVGYYTTTVARTSINLVSLVLFIIFILVRTRGSDVDR